MNCNKLLRSGFCTGCGLCQSHFGKNNVKYSTVKGHIQPQFGDIVKKDWLLNYCPGLNMECDITASDNATYDSIFGTVSKIYLGWSLDERIRFNASTGGVATTILAYLLDTKKVECIVEVIKNEKNPMMTDTVVITSSSEVYSSTSGSRYCPSSPLISIKEVLEKYNKVGIIGKGCDIRAIKKYQSVYFRDKKIITIGIFCGGIPSYYGTKSIIKKFEIPVKEVVDLRYRGYGWPGTFSVKTDMQEYNLNYRDSWALYLSKTLNPVCKFCFDGIAEFADISLADGWYGARKDGYPNFEEREGRNLIFSRNEMGKKILDGAKESGYLFLEESSLCDEIYYMQPSQKQRRITSKYRFIGLRMCGFKYPLVDKKHLKKISSTNFPIRIKIRYVFGSVRRLIKK